MSEQLDWLARNVHVWPTDTIIPCGHEIFEEGAEFLEDVVRWTVNKNRCRCCHLTWRDRRAELQNKPSWKDAPEWALAVTQRINGEWFWLMTTDQFKGTSSSSGCVGEVLGDWRDTLEQRPAFYDGGHVSEYPTEHQSVCAVLDGPSDLSEQAATGQLAAGKIRWDGESYPKAVQAGTSAQKPSDLSERAVTARLQEATDNVLAAVPELKSDRYKFEPFTSLEDASQAANGAQLVGVEPTLHTIHHAAFLHQGCQLLLSEPELVVFRTADGELIHCKPKECLIDPDVYGLAARLLADMSGHPVAPEHMRELVEQMGWSV